MKTLIFYHNDVDGLTSALGFTYNDYMQNHDNKIPSYEDLRKDYFFFEVHYGIKNIFEYFSDCGFDWDRFDRVVVLDFCFNKNIMLQLLEKYKENFIWFDHHKNTIDELSKYDIPGMRHDLMATSTIVWRYFDKKPCLFSRYVEDMDIWKWELPNSNEILQYVDFLYMQINDKDNPEKEFEIINLFLKYFNDEYFNSQIAEIANQGKLTDVYIKTKVKDDINKGKKTTFEGYNAFVLNSQFKPGFVSDYIFNNKDYDDIELVIVWYKSYAKSGEKQNFDKVSLRSKSIDCSEIARKYGGNGHPKASGFVISDIDDIIQ